MTKQQVKDAIAVLLTIPVILVSKLQEAYDLVLDFFTGSNVVDIVPLWTIGATFNTDGTGDGLYCKHPDTNGDLRIFETKTDGNIGNEPPTDPLVTENSNWLEISPSSGSAIREWEAGTYGAGLIIVFHNHSVYGPGLAILSEPTRPFNSANIENEITTGKWTWLSVDRSLYQFVHLTDDTDITWNLASRKISTALLDTNETAINLTLQNILQGTHHSLYLRKQQAGDLVITPLFNSLPVFEVGNSVSSSTITLSGVANTLFKIDFARLDVPIGATLLGTTGEAVNFHIVALDEDNLVAGMQEFIKKSTDGGLNWSTVETAISQFDYFDKLSFAGAVGLASVRGGSLRRSADSGDSWSSLTPAGPDNYQGSVLVIDSSVHYYVNANSHIVKKTIDSGANFTNITIPANTNSWPLHSICKGTSAGTIYVGSNIGRIFKTVDAGANWTVLTIPGVLFRVKVLQFESDLIGYAASDSANLYKTINGGSSWTQVSIPPGIGDIKEIGILGASKVIVVGTGGVAYSLDGGALWNLSTDITNIVSCSVVDEENIFLLTSNGNVYKYVVSLTNAVIFVVDKNDSVSQEYVDAQILASIEGIRWKSSVKARTTAALPASTVSGANTILTANANGAFPNQDGIAIALDDDILVANEAAQENNGIYTLTDAGSAGTPWVLTRRGDADSSIELQNAVVNVDQGTVHADTTWRQDTDSIVLGTSAIMWNAFSITVADASESVKGIAEIATQGETDTGTDDLRIVTPLKLKNYNQGSFGTLKRIKVSLSSAEILNLNTSPKELIAAPGAGKAINVLKVFLIFNFITTAYSGSSTLRFRYGTSTWSDDSGNFINRVTDGIQDRIPAFGALNQDLNVSFNLTVPFGNPTLGDGTLDVVIFYSIEDL